MGIFRAYDIRGIYPSELDANIALKLGLAFGKFNPGKLAVAMDMRLSSPLLTKAVTAGLLATGCDVIDIGMVPSPVLYYAVASKKLDGGAMVTASHNPAKYNGFKFCLKDAICISGETGIMDLKKMIEGDLKKADWNRVGKLTKEDIIQDYFKYLNKLAKPERKLKIVIDAGNGSCGFTEDFFKQFGEVTMLFGKPDGRFPNHIPDPLDEENLEFLKKEVLKQKADLGIAFDGDGDRVGFVDNRGRFVSGDFSLMIFAKNVLEKKKGKVLFEVRGSRALQEYIKSLGGEPVMVRIGHSFIHEDVLKHNALVAGELSGHIYFGKPHYGYDDGILAALKMIEFVSKIDDLASFIDKLPRYVSSPEIRITCSDEKKFKIVGEVQKELKKKGYKVIDIDGARVEFEEGWGLIRASNTQPAIGLRFEGKNSSEMEKIKKEFMDLLKSKMGNMENL
jgi:phosphomannomutase/phosphoglucomutase